MRIAATADLHFTPQNYDRIREPLSRVRDEADLLIIAGDLTNYGKPEEMHSLLNGLVRLRVPIVAILGNHDYESGQENELIKMMTNEGIKFQEFDNFVGGRRSFTDFQILVISQRQCDVLPDVQARKQSSMAIENDAETTPERFEFRSFAA